MMTRPGANLVHRVLGVVLSLAALLKAWKVFASLDDETASIFVLVGAGIELIIGVALVLRAWRSVTIPAAALLFTSLAGVAWIGIRRGALSCGCFGDIAVPPWIFFAFDLAATSILLRELVPPGGSRDRRTSVLLVACLASFFIGQFVGAKLYPSFGPVTTETSRKAIEAASAVIIDPGRLRGRSFPYLAYIRIDADLSQGDWKIILARPGCMKCRQSLREGECQPEAGERVAVVLAEAKEDWKLPPECQALLGLMSQDKTWVFQSPMVIRLVNGQVSDVR